MSPKHADFDTSIKNAPHFLAKIQLFEKILKKIGCSIRSSFFENFLSL